jgi:hypothetical protein
MHGAGDFYGQIYTPLTNEKASSIADSGSLRDKDRQTDRQIYTHAHAIVKQSVI